MIARSAAFQAVLDESLAASCDRQAWLQEMLGEADWQFDMGDGTLSFTASDGRVLVSRCQVLGTESMESRTWLWGWANERSAMPGVLLRAAQAVRSFGMESAIAELTEGSLPLDVVDGHTLASVAGHLYPCAGYYRAPYEGGALLVLLTSATLVEPKPPALVRLTAGWARALAAAGDQFTDQRRGLASYARSLGLSHRDEGGNVVVHSSDGAAVVSFDGDGRTTGISTKSSVPGN